ncbi:MAG: thioredoxin family protein [Phycisphaerae bacterium]|nr:thioredoxin family protein [Phycisphaerae bacterium]
MKRERLYLMASLVLLMATATRAEEPFADLTFDEALAKAGKENKVVMIDFFTTWCGPCKMLDRSTWPNPDVRKLLSEKAIPIKVDAEKNRPLSQKYAISSYPQLVFIRPDGTEIDRIVGFVGPDVFIQSASGPLAGKDRITIMREALASNPNDPIQRLRLGDAMVQRGKLDEALVEYLWCFDEGPKHKPEFASIRNAFLAGKIAGLGQRNPAAVAALEQRRGEASKALLAATGRAEQGADAAAAPKHSLTESAATVVAIDRALMRSAGSIALYDQLKSQGETATDARRALASSLFDALWNAKRYEDMLNDCGDPDKRFGDDVARYTAGLPEMEKQDPRAKEFMRAQVITPAARFVEALLATKRLDAADALSRKVIEFDGTGRAYAALISNAVRAGDNKFAESLAAQARQKLSPKELAAIEPVLRSIPGEVAPTSAPAQP